MHLRSRYTSVGSFECGSVPHLFSHFLWLAVNLSSLPYSSFGKESTCNAGDASSIPGIGRSTGEEIGYLLQYSWASLVAQLVKNPPAIFDL